MKMEDTEKPDQGLCKTRADYPYVLAFLFICLIVNAEVSAAKIDNVASALVQLNGGPQTMLNSNIVSLQKAPPPKPSSVRLMQYAPAASKAESLMIPPTRCGLVDGPLLTLPALTTHTGKAIDTSKPVKLTESTTFSRNEAIFINLIDANVNVNSAVVETLPLVIKESKSNTRIQVIIRETGPDTGQFAGYVYPETCGLPYSDGLALSVEYVDPIYPFDSSLSEILVDPYGVVFNSSTGELINGARVTLFNLDTNSLATVTSFDGITSYPNSLISGDGAVDGSGQNFDFPDGFYRFPTIPPGRYQLRVIPPPGFTHPSSVSTDDLQQLQGAPFVIVVGSRGEIFVVNPGPAVHIDIPLDPVVTAPFVTKKAGRNIAAIGDLLEYQVTVFNPNENVSFQSPILRDELPPGFRVHPETVRVNGNRLGSENLRIEGRTIEFHIDPVAPLSEVIVSYVTELGPGSKTGAAVNSARLQTASGEVSNTATVTVEVRDELFRNRGFIMGRVTEFGCGDKEGKQAVGIEGVGIYLEDGTFTVTDDDGRYHFEGIRPGTHVVQMDPTTVPEGYRLRLCETNSRTSAAGMSQFVQLQSGSLQRANFYLERVPSFDLSQLSRYGGEVAEDSSVQETSIMEQYDDNWLAQQSRGIDWVFPTRTYIPPIPSTHVLLKHLPGQSINLILNGEAVSPLNFDSVRKNKNGSVAMSHWRGVDLEPGDNIIRADIRDHEGNIIKSIETSLHYPTAPVRVEFVPELSTLVADARTTPVVAIRLFDKDDYPARPGVGGFYSVSAPYSAYQSQNDKAKRAQQFVPDRRPEFRVEKDGLAYLPFTPTDTSGELVINVSLDEKTRQEVRAWIASPVREWLLVGLAEGSLAHNQLSGNMQELPAGVEDGFYNDNRLAFFAKGQIQGKWLLTLAYDNKPSSGEEDNSLFQQIDPEKYYPVYADASVQQSHAPSAGDLFVRLERDTFYALLGDYNTGLTVTELGRYSRSLYGLKSGFNGEYLSYTVFAANTDRSFIKDEIRGDGSSGRYYLTRNNIVHNSETVSIETRDRFQSESILQQQALTRYIDYDIDYATGSLFFKLPVGSRDSDFNPVIIVVDYETQTTADKAVNTGGRVAGKFFEDRLETGASVIYEGTEGADARLEAIDIRMQIDQHTEVRAEAAHSRRHENDEKLSGTAFIVEAKRNNGVLDGKLYFRQQKDDFGLGQQRMSESGTRKLGFDIEADWRKQHSLEMKGFRQEIIDSGISRDVIEVRNIFRGRKKGYHIGADWARDGDEQKNRAQSLRLLLGVNYSALDDRLLGRLNSEIALPGQDHNRDYPTRLTAGTDFRLNDALTLFAEHEFSDGMQRRVHTTNFGYRSTPWAGAQTKSYLGREINENSSRLFSNMGFQQRWLINERWSVDLNVDRSNTLDESGTAQEQNASVFTAHGATEDFVAFSTGANYRNNGLLGFSRAEYRSSDNEERTTLGLGVYRELRNGFAHSASLDLYREKFNTSLENRNLELQFGIAYRPEQSRWIILNRSDLRLDRRNLNARNNNTYKFIGNLHLNYEWNLKTRLAFRLGLKISHDTFENTQATAISSLSGLELRRDISKRWDIGLHGDVLRSWSLNSSEYALGASLGFSPVRNTWVSLGYNFSGFTENDFIDTDYRSRGVFVATRLKFDQTTAKTVTQWFQSR